MFGMPGAFFRIYSCIVYTVWKQEKKIFLSSEKNVSFGLNIHFVLGKFFRFFFNTGVLNGVVFFKRWSIHSLVGSDKFIPRYCHESHDIEKNFPDVYHYIRKAKIFIVVKSEYVTVLPFILLKKRRMWAISLPNIFFCIYKETISFVDNL